MNFIAKFETRYLLFRLYHTFISTYSINIKQYRVNWKIVTKKE